MTKKFFKDWSERRSLTESIELKKGLQYEKMTEYSIYMEIC